MKANMESNQGVTTTSPTQQQPQQQQQTAAGDQNKQFVVTPDYIQQSMLLYQPSVIVYNPNCTTYPLQNDYANRF